MYPRLGLTRTVVRRNYALISSDGHVASALPGWTGTVANVIISEAMGAKVTQLLLTLEAGGRGTGATGENEWFFYLIAGAGEINGNAVTVGSYAFVPAGGNYDFSAAEGGAKLLIFRKRYEPLVGAPAPAFLVGQESQIQGLPFLGDDQARLKTLLPDGLGFDMAVNIFTYDPGATLPFVETHIMEHGMLFLTGSGVYRLDEDWHPVNEGDAIWIAPYCPQWFIAAGPEPARYIYYKDVNRMP